MNTAIPNHPLVGTRKVFRPDQQPYDPATDTEGGTLVIAPGFECEIRSVFQNWNGVSGLDMLNVYCPATSQSTHITPADLGLPPL